MKKKLFPPSTGLTNKEANQLLSRFVRFFSMVLYPVFIVFNFFVSRIRDIFDLEPEKEELIPAKPGDVICVHRIGFEHFGVYIGDDRVIHYDIDPQQDFKICIHEAPLKQFLNGMDIYYTCYFPAVYGVPTENMEYSGFKKLMEHPERSDQFWNYLKAVKYHLYTPEETIARAKSRLGESDYHLIVNNCEHFAIWCKTGISESHQIGGLLDTLMMTDMKGSVLEMSASMAGEKIVPSKR